jgi:hypothetical protein
MKTLTNYGDFTGSRIIIPMLCVIVILSSPYNNTDGTSMRMGNLNLAFEKPTANHPPRDF